MASTKKRGLINFDDSHLLLYKRYVDDTFCVFNNEQDAMSFFDFIKILSIRTLNSLLRNKLTANILFGYINSKKIVLKIVKNIFITTNRPHNIGITTLLLVIDVCKFF